MSMLTPPQKEALDKEKARLLAMTDEEFLAELDRRKDSDLYHTLRYTLDPNYEISQPE